MDQGRRRRQGRAELMRTFMACGSASGRDRGGRRNTHQLLHLLAPGAGALLEHVNIAFLSRRRAGNGGRGHKQGAGGAATQLAAAVMAPCNRPPWCGCRPPLSLC